MGKVQYQPVIGLEVHIELKTKSKMFCSCRNDPDERHPNLNICPICLGHPGTLPVINQEAVKKTIKTGLALNCQIAEYSQFDRKNYFYPDLPKGYQISQFYHPLTQNGYLDIREDSHSNSLKFARIRIREIHLEEDTGKLIHEKNCSLVDFNRAGIPLMELATEPDLRSAKEARQFAEEFHLLMHYLDVSDADMEKGEMRVEVNVSLLNPSQINFSNLSRIGLSNPSRIVLKDESYKIMGLLFKVHNILGPIYKEQNYKDAIEDILRKENISYEREKEIKGEFCNLKFGKFYADFVIDNKILLEVKTKPFITNEDIRQVSRYIKAANLPLGILVNFKKGKLEYKRVINPVFEKDSRVFEKDSRVNIREGLENCLGTKVEIKNLNSFRAVERAIEYEIQRQTKLLNQGKKIIQETRGWDDIKGITVGQREKEGAYDYRYFPEPDLPPLHITKDIIEEIRAEIPELPQQKRERFKKEYQLDEKTIEFFVYNKNLGEYFENAMSELRNWVKEIEMKEKVKEEEFFKLSKICSNYLISDLQGLLKSAPHHFFEKSGGGLITPENFAEFIALIYEGKISSKIAKMVLEEMFKTGADPSQIIEEKGLSQITDESEIEKIVQEVLIKNPKAVENYKTGKENVFQFLIGQTMALTKGKANPQKVSEILEKKLRET